MKSTHEIDGRSTHPSSQKGVRVRMAITEFCCHHLRLFWGGHPHPSRRNASARFQQSLSASGSWTSISRPRSSALCRFSIFRASMRPPTSISPLFSRSSGTSPAACLCSESQAMWLSSLVTSRFFCSQLSATHLSSGLSPNTTTLEGETYILI